MVSVQQLCHYIFKHKNLSEIYTNCTWFVFVWIKKIAMIFILFSIASFQFLYDWIDCLHGQFHCFLVLWLFLTQSLDFETFMRFNNSHPKKNVWSFHRKNCNNNGTIEKSTQKRVKDRCASLQWKCRWLQATSHQTLVLRLKIDVSMTKIQSSIKRCTC